MKKFGRTTNGEMAYLISLRNQNGMKTELTNYGASVVSIQIPSKNSGFCLEAEFAPNAINNRLEEQPIIKKGDRYHKSIIYKYLFDTINQSHST